MFNFIAIDLETTGLDPESGERVIEVGAVKIVNGIVDSEFGSLICCDRRISKGAEKVNRISKKMLVNQPTAKDVFNELTTFISTSQIVAHNADFELKFLKNEYSLLGESFHQTIQCSLKLSRKCLPNIRSYSLDSVASYLKIEINSDQRHRALNDARVAAKIWLALQNLVTTGQ
jgi:DNA polymerase III epsilon subunit